MTSDVDLLRGLAETWSSIDSVLSVLTPQQWLEPTDCPGWNVQAQVSHLSGFESAWYLGRRPGVPIDTATIAIDGASTPHVRNSLGVDNEAWIVERADWDCIGVLSEFREVVSSRAVQLSSPDFDAISPTWRGDETLRDQLALRLFDTWVHEQDIRRAVAMPGGWDGIAALHCVDRMLSSLPFVVGKQAKLDDGSTIAVSLFGLHQQTVAVTVDGGRAKIVSAAQYQPQAALTMHEETFMCVATGRRTPESYLDANKISLRGDQDLARRVATHLKIVNV
jgi:uncharacterized protein (TIGR03083 family)